MDVDKRYSNEPDDGVVEIRVRGFKIGFWTWVLIGITPVSLAVCHFFPDFVAQYLMVVPKSLTGLFQVWRLVTASLLCGSVEMLVWGILSLIFVFRMLEEWIGRRRAWKFLLISTVAGNLVLWMIFPANEPSSFGILMVFFTATGGLWYTHRNEKLAFIFTPKHPVRARMILAGVLIFSLINWIWCGLWLTVIFALLLVCIGYWTMRLMDHMAEKRIRNKAAASGSRGNRSYIELE